MKKESRKFLILGIIFLIMWAIYMLLISPTIDNLFTEVIANIIKTIIKFVMWCGFGAYFICKYNKDLWLKKENLFKLTDVNLLVKLLVMITITAFLAMFRTHGNFNINEFTIDDFFNKFLLVGIEEELVFRALILNGLSKHEKFIKASLITSFIFALIHVPLYIRTGIEITTIMLNVIKIVCVSSIYNYIFKESKSLWHILVVHSLWDLLYFLFVA